MDVQAIALHRRMTGRPYSEEYMKERLEAYRKATRELDSATAIGAYIISDEAAKVLEELASRPRHEDSFSQLDQDASEYPRVLREMRELAKKDLKVS